MRIVPDDRGFTFVEVLLAAAILLVAMAALLQVVAAGQRLTRVHTEATDLHQRVRVAVERMQRDLVRAGAGASRGSASVLAGALTGYMAPIRPARAGARLADSPLAAYADRITVVFVEDGAWPTTLVATMTTAADPVHVDSGAPGCPAAGVCGFTEGSRALLIDPRGVGAGHEVFTVTGIGSGLAHDAPNPPFARPYEAGSIVAPIVQRTYYLDRANRRLMVYDGYQSDVPLVDNVLDLRIQYFADVAPSSVARPPAGVASCVYSAALPPEPLLAGFGASGLHPLTLDELSDGPECGAEAAAFDGDLLRIRLVRVTLRVQAAADDVRGASASFARPGRATSSDGQVADVEVTFDVAPRNMQPWVLLR
jgi:prepilin-type N-terminal cleavage/methylation domain-containing protein